MLVAFGQHQRRAAFVNGLEHVVADELIAGFIRDQFRVQFLKLDSHILGKALADGRNPVGRTCTACVNGRAAACALASTR